MATHDYSLANQSGASFRTDLNNALAAIQSNNSNSSSPATTVAYQWWADTNAAILKIRNSSNNAWINLFTLAGGIDVDAASTFSEDVTFEGATSGRNIVFDRSDDALEWNDNAKAKFGAGQDLQIFHDGTDSFIDNATGGLKILGNTIRLKGKSHDENMIVATVNDAAQLYFDNSLRLATDANGVAVTTNVTFPDNGVAVFGAGSDLQIYHDGSNGFIKDGGGSSGLVIQTPALAVKNTGGSENLLVASQNGAVELMFDNTKRIETNNSGAFVTGELGCDGLYMGDSERVKMGSSDDLQLYHDGSNSYIQHGTVGNLRYQSNNHDFYNQAGNEFMCRMFNDDAVVLYFDHNTRFTTESTGAKVNGKYRQETSGGNIVYARQVFRESIAGNATKTFTITGLAYGNVKLTMGFGDGNFHYAAFSAVLGGNMFASGNAYAANELLNNRSGVNSITVTKSNSSYAVAIHAGTNQIFGSVVVESNGYDTHGGVTLTIS